ncbi:MAG: MFS transporter, partial [Pseudomonadota bacterium]
TFSVFLGPIGADLGAGPGELALAYSAATLAAAFALPFMGKLVDRHGPRRMTLSVALLLGLACLAFGAVPGLIWLGLGFAALRFLGQGSLMLNSANLVSQWFERKRGFAMSLMSLGFAASIAVHPPLGAWLIGEVGWRWAWVILGLSTWAMLLPVYWLLVHDKPEAVGLEPDGGDEGAAINLGPQAVGGTDVGLTQAQALRTPAFYILIFAMMSFAMFMTILHFFGVEIMVEKRLPPEQAAWIFPIVATVMAVSMPLVGRLLDRLRTRVAIALSMLFQSGALLAATLVAGWGSAIAYAAIFGVTNAWGMTLFAYVWPRYFGRKHLGSIQGTGQTVLVVGASIAPPAVGWWAEASGGFDAPLYASAAYPLIGAVLALLFLTTPEPVRSRLARD